MADNCASSAEEIVSEMSLSQVKAELQRRGLPAKGKKSALMARLIVAIKQEESNPPSLQNKSKGSTHIGPKQALAADNMPAASTGELLSSQSPNHQLSNFQLLRRKEIILKTDINSVTQVILETTKSPSNNVIRIENRVQKLNGYMESCSEVREEIMALISDDEVAEEAQRWIDYHRDPETKRSLLSIASRVFDPMGLITPFTIRAKILFQELWQKGLQWEDQSDEDIAKQWRSWKSELSQLSCITIPRYFMENIGSSSRIELHGFGDASPKAYGAAVYIKCLDETGHASTHLVMSKSRVAPAKAVSLPRLELLAAVVNARLLKFVVESLTLTLKVEQVVCWTDSMVTLQWIRGSSSQWKTFVANRVAEIQSTWDPHHWKHCSGEDNPADLLTRGVPVKVLADSKLWWSGPCWLSSQCLPEQRESPNELTESVEKERKQRVTRTCALITMEPVIDPSRYEQWLTLIRVTAFVLRGVRAFKSGISAGSKELSAEELQDAKLRWYREIQKEVYQAEYERLEEDLSLPNTSAILKLDPYYDKRDRLLRVGGRLQHSDLPEGTRHPIILPHGHAVIERIIQSVHKELLHAGPEGTLSVLQEIWLTKGRREVKRNLKKCLVCRRQRVGPCSQKMVPLPSERVSLSPAFSHVGVDFAGPLFVRGSASPEKAYICIFTCASFCMTHLELTGDLSTKEFFPAFLRMIGRRGLCRTIWSDNAKTFKCADHEIQQLFTKESSVNKGLWDRIDQEELQAKLTSKGIK
ncbi:uncharacterized protein LOC111344814 [Stylophora pistillata]|nr:uncharacterized protein LOC111344814 [Stylophora pistillata]